jgi:hypothetical protein
MTHKIILVILLLRFDGFWVEQFTLKSIYLVDDAKCLKVFPTKYVSFYRVIVQ